jgi:hypothetical protein
MMDDQSQTKPQADCFCHGAGPRFTHNMRECQAKCSVEHFRKSGVEFLKGLRTLLDLGIDRLSDQPQARGASINVD